MSHSLANVSAFRWSLAAMATTFTSGWLSAGLMSASGAIRAAPRIPKRSAFSSLGGRGGLFACYRCDMMRCRLTRIGWDLYKTVTYEPSSAEKTKVKEHAWSILPGIPHVLMSKSSYQRDFAMRRCTKSLRSEPWR